MQVGLKLCKYFRFQVAYQYLCNWSPFFFSFFFCLEFDFELLLRVQPSWFTAPMSDTNPGAAILVHSLSMKSREGLTFSRTLKSQCVRYKTAAPTAKPLTFKCWFVTNPTTLNGLKNCCECICPPPPPPPPPPLLKGLLMFTPLVAVWSTEFSAVCFRMHHSCFSRLVFAAIRWTYAQLFISIFFLGIGGSLAIKLLLE